MVMKVMLLLLLLLTLFDSVDDKWDQDKRIDLNSMANPSDPYEMKVVECNHEFLSRPMVLDLAWLDYPFD